MFIHKYACTSNIPAARAGLFTVDAHGLQLSDYVVHEITCTRSVQDQKLTRVMAELQAASAQSEDSAKQVSKLREENDTVREHQSKLQMKLKECKVQLEANEKLIRWLNSQVMVD